MLSTCPRIGPLLLACRCTYDMHIYIYIYTYIHTDVDDEAGSLLLSLLVVVRLVVLLLVALLGAPRPWAGGGTRDAGRGTDVGRGTWVHLAICLSIYRCIYLSILSYPILSHPILSIYLSIYLSRPIYLYPNRERRGLFKMCDEPESPNEGAPLRYVIHMMNRGGVFKIYDYDEPEAQIEGACLRHMMSGISNARACLRYMMNRNCQMRGRVINREGVLKINHAPESSNEGACLISVMNRAT